MNTNEKHEFYTPNGLKIRLSASFFQHYSPENFDTIMCSTEVMCALRSFFSHILYIWLLFNTPTTEIPAKAYIVLLSVFILQLFILTYFRYKPLFFLIPILSIPVGIYIVYIARFFIPTIAVIVITVLEKQFILFLIYWGIYFLFSFISLIIERSYWKKVSLKYDLRLTDTEICTFELFCHYYNSCSFKEAIKLYKDWVVLNDYVGEWL